MLGLISAIVVGLIGTFIANALGVGTTRGIDWIELIIQVALAAAGVARSPAATPPVDGACKPAPPTGPKAA